jgi:hypothetical protein
MALTPFLMATIQPALCAPSVPCDLSVAAPSGCRPLSWRPACLHVFSGSTLFLILNIHPNSRMSTTKWCMTIKYISKWIRTLMSESMFSLTFLEDCALIKGISQGRDWPSHGASGRDPLAPPCPTLTSHHGTSMGLDTTQLLRAIMHNESMSAPAKTIAYTIALHLNNENLKCFPSEMLSSIRNTNTSIW